MDRDLAKALRLLQKVQTELQQVLTLLEQVAAKHTDSTSKKPAPKNDDFPKDPEFWREEWQKLETAFEVHGTSAVESFVKEHKLDFLIQFLRHNHVPMPGRSKPTKKEIMEEVVQRLREQRALKRSAFTGPPRSLRGGEEKL